MRLLDIFLTYRVQISCTERSFVLDCPVNAKDIPYFCNRYQCSKKGEVWDKKKKKFLIHRLNGDGYLYVTLSCTKEEYFKYIRIRKHLNKRKEEDIKNPYVSIPVGLHRILALVFLPNPNNFPTVDHINRVKTDNRLENLRWANYSTQATNRNKTSHYIYHKYERRPIKKLGISLLNLMNICPNLNIEQFLRHFETYPMWNCWDFISCGSCASSISKNQREVQSDIVEYHLAWVRYELRKAGHILEEEQCKLA